MLHYRLTYKIERIREKVLIIQTSLSKGPWPLLWYWLKRFIGLNSTDWLEVLDGNKYLYDWQKANILSSLQQQLYIYSLTSFVVTLTIILILVKKKKENMKLQRSETERKIEKPKGKIWQIFEDLKSRKDDEQNLEYITPTIFVKMWGLFSYARPFDEKLFFGGKLAFRSTCFISTEAEMLPIFFVKSRQCTIYKTRDCRPHN